MFPVLTLNLTLNLNSGPRIIHGVATIHEIYRFCNAGKSGLQAVVICHAREVVFPEVDQVDGEIGFFPLPTIVQHARRLWPLPRPPRTAAAANKLIDLYRRTVVADDTTFHLQIRASW